MVNKNEKINWGVSIFLIVLAITLLVINITKETSLEKEIKQVRNMVMEKHPIGQESDSIKIDDDWNCKKRGGMTDLLQPSGYWINQTFNCWKLEIPIEKYCEQNPLHCGK